MQKKCKIFISSSFKDLEKERMAVILSTLKRNHIPTGMELFTPTPGSSLDYIESEIRDSDIFVILIGARLGTPIDDEPDALTFIEQEYQWANKYHLPIIVFLLDEDEFESERNDIPGNSSERDQEKGLRKFRETVKQTETGKKRIVGSFSHNNLGKLSDDYGNAIRECINHLELSGKLSGWISFKHYNSIKQEMESKIFLDNTLSINPFVKTFIEKLQRFGKLSNRANLQSNLKQCAANYFWERYFSKLYDNSIKHIFFESGSSIAYVSDKFIDFVKNKSDSFYRKGIEKEIQLHTNNIFTYLNFILLANPWRPIDIRVNPQGIFFEDYGGTYGELSFVPPKSPPIKNDPIRKCLPEATQIVVDNEVMRLNNEFKNSALILMTVSGIDVRTLSIEAPYPGPHVGSYPNMLLKRCLLSINSPKVVFIDPNKWDFNFVFGNCHAICDESFPWDGVILEHPLAIVIATESKDEQKRIGDELCEYGLTFLEFEEPKAGTEGSFAVIASNKLFNDYFKEQDETCSRKNRLTCESKGAEAPPVSARN